MAGILYDAPAVLCWVSNFIIMSLCVIDIYVRKTQGSTE